MTLKETSSLLCCVVFPGDSLSRVNRKEESAAISEFLEEEEEKSTNLEERNKIKGTREDDSTIQ